MRIVCGYTSYGIRPETKENLAQYAPDTEYVDVEGDLFAYWRAIQERWTGEEDLMVVEQDMLLHADVVPSFKGCIEDWCTYSYLLYDWYTYWSLGCTKFSVRLQRLFPDIPKVPFYHLDMAIRTVLWDYRTPHLHGFVGHLHDYEPERIPFLRRKRQEELDNQGAMTLREDLEACGFLATWGQDLVPVNYRKRGEKPSGVSSSPLSQGGE